MIGVTLFGVFLTPVFFFVLLWLRERRRPALMPQPAAPAAEAVEGTPPSEAITRPRGG
jgi:hypothetical protein